MRLRPYQETCCRQVTQKWDEFNRLLVVIPTGGGKTIIFANIAAQVTGRVLILAHREELLQQAIDKIRKATGISASLERAEDRANPNSKVVVASIQTIVRRLDRFPADHFAFIIIDEAHHVAANTYQSILGHFAKAKVLGVTATPDRSDRKALGEHFDAVAYEVTLLDLIHDKFLVPIRARVCDVSIDLSKVSFSAGDFDSTQASESIEPYLGRIADQVKEFGGKKTMIFLPLIKTSMLMRDLCIERGLDAEHVDGNSSDREEILKRFAAKERGIICNAMLLTEGYDEPSIDTIVVLRPTRSRALYTQMIGRGTRLHPDKTHLTILDFLWMTGRHRLVRPTSLISEGEVEQLADKATAKQGEFDLEDEVLKATHEREKALLRSLAEKKKNAGKFIDPVEFAVSIHSSGVAEYEPTFAWQRQPPSERQIASLIQMGFDAQSIRDKGHASALLDAVYSRSKLNLATPKQVRFLRRFGVPKPETISFKQASEIIGRMIKK